MQEKENENGETPENNLKEDGETPENNEKKAEETQNETPAPEKKAKAKKSQKMKEKKAKLKEKAVKKKEKTMKKILLEKHKVEERKNLFTTDDQLSRLEKYDLEDSKDPDNNAFIADEKFKGPTRFLYLYYLGVYFLFF